VGNIMPTPVESCISDPDLLAYSGHNFANELRFMALSA
jgi:hypothetical protein